MKTKTLLLLSVLAFAACQKDELNQIEENESPKYAILYNGNSPYLDWYYTNNEAFVTYFLRDYPNNPKGGLREKVTRAEDHTISVNKNVNIRIHDEYKFSEEDNTTFLYPTRTADINGTKSVQYIDQFNIPSASPIEIIRPQVDNCNPIPMCYYDNFEIEWNGDKTNHNGVVIIAEWNGCTMHKPAEPTSWANIDIVKDSGLATLNTALFDKMPDKALVNLWLIRGNLLTFGDQDGTFIKHIQELSPGGIMESLSQQPKQLLDLQPFMLGSAAVSTFSFFLIRDLDK